MSGRTYKEKRKDINQTKVKNNRRIFTILQSLKRYFLTYDQYMVVI